MEAFTHTLWKKRKHKLDDREEAQQLLQNPLYYAASMVDAGLADCCVAGSIATTADVIRAAIHVLGLKSGTSTVSSTFLMAMPDGNVYTYADCGVVPYPDKEQLADIALESARTHRLLTCQEPRVAMLSFSTKGSAVHPRSQLVQEALKIAKRINPELIIDGELQFDAAIIPDIAKRKAPESPLAGNANVFIFPNLDAGNIAYKITERLAGATATGPILQGLAKPMMDLSRGCNWNDIVNAACVAILMGE
jgi:phosphate acetyltransferase